MTSIGDGLRAACTPTSCKDESPLWLGGKRVAHAYEYIIQKGRDGTISAVV